MYPTYVDVLQSEPVRGALPAPFAGTWAAWYGTEEVGNYGPQKGLRCGCYFDAKTIGSTTCAACNTASDCPSDHPACNYGYCEVN